MAVMELEKQFFIHTSMVGDGDYIRPAAILDLFQDLASLHANKLGIGFDDIVKLDYYWIVSSIEFEEFKPFKSIEEVKVKTWPLPKNRLEFIREFEIRNLNDELLVKGISTWVVIDKNTRKLTRGEKIVFNGEYKEETNYPNYRRKKMNLPTTSPIKEWDYKVLRTDLDHNGHMNNAKYADIVYNGLDIFSITKNLQILFLHEALVNEIIHMSYYKEGNEEIFVGKINDEICFQMVMEVK